MTNRSLMFSHPVRCLFALVLLAGSPARAGTASFNLTAGAALETLEADGKKLALDGALG